MKKMKFQKTLYVRRETEGADEPFLVVHESAEDHAVHGEVVEVAVYKLEHVGKVVSKAELVKS